MRECLDIYLQIASELQSVLPDIAGVPGRKQEDFPFYPVGLVFLIPDIDKVTCDCIHASVLPLDETASRRHRNGLFRSLHVWGYAQHEHSTTVLFAIALADILRNVAQYL